jgi:radical SAM protein with 4Fe4S-binding SPASM domain
MENKVDYIETDKNNPRNASPEFDHLFYMRIFEGCNLHCDHCFIPSNPKKMEIDDFVEAAKSIQKNTKDGQRILIQWHGGEPTALPAGYFRQAITQIEQGKGNRQFIHGIQTNLMNYNEAWRDIYREFFDSNIGVSWDYGIRKTKVGKKSNEEYEEKFWCQFERLLSDGITPYLVITGTKVFFERFKNPFELFSFLVSKGVKHLHIERLTKTGYARDNWGTLGMTNKEYSDYMSRMYRAYLMYSIGENTRDTLHISPFDGLKDSLQRLKAGGAGGYGCLSGVCDSRFHTIDANGYKKGCTALTSEYDNKSSGESVVFFSDFKIARKIRQLDCRTCEFNKICSSGCLATEKMDESNECSGSYTLFKTIQVFI